MADQDQSTVTQTWQDALDPQLVRRLLRPMVQPGLIDSQLIRALMSRFQGMVDGLPLLADLVQRHGQVEKLQGKGTPIVYAQPLTKSLGREAGTAASSGLALPRPPVVRVTEAVKTPARGPIGEAGPAVLADAISPAQPTPAADDQPLPKSGEFGGKGSIRIAGPVTPVVQARVVRRSLDPNLGAIPAPRPDLVYSFPPTAGSRDQSDGPTVTASSGLERPSASSGGERRARSILTAAQDQRASRDAPLPRPSRPVVRPVQRQIESLRGWAQPAPGQQRTGTGYPAGRAGDLPLVIPQPAPGSNGDHSRLAFVPATPGAGVGRRGASRAVVEGAAVDSGPPRFDSGQRPGRGGPSVPGPTYPRSPSVSNPSSAADSAQETVMAAVPAAGSEREIDLADLAEKVQGELDMETLVVKVQRELRRRLVVEAERRGWK